ncbi:plasmid mobilization protein [Paracoccus sphaerophysae]|nr:hypothetical protein [Paracoccus sphaerophysae]
MEKQKRTQVSFRMTAAQFDELQALVKQSGLSQNEYLVERALSTKGKSFRGDIDRRLGEVGFLLNDILEAMKRKRMHRKQEIIQELLAEYGRLMEAVVSDLRNNAPLS